MVRPIDQEPIVTEKIVSCSSQEEGTHRATRATQGSSRVIQEVEGTEGKCRQEAFTGVSLGMEWGRQCGQAQQL